jgi:3-oxoacyl-[acyl-carrier-protein] synthase-3
MALAAGILSGQISGGQRVALLGIGSGINSVMQATQWQRPQVAGELDEAAEKCLGSQLTATAGSEPA